eukprot:2468008-Pleurochrysis_carterae.AAC.1
MRKLTDVNARPCDKPASARVNKRGRCGLARFSRCVIHEESRRKLDYSGAAYQPHSTCETGDLA